MSKVIKFPNSGAEIDQGGVRELVYPVVLEGRTYMVPEQLFLFIKHLYDQHVAAQAERETR